MDERKISDSCLSSLMLCEEKVNDWYPMYFGVSCAFFALRLLPGRETDDDEWSEVWNTILHGSAQLLGLLVWKAQKKGADEGKGELLAKLEMAERERDELKRIRHEDAKANEKVVRIFAAQEQKWFSERKRLQQQIRSLSNEGRVLGKKKDEEISGLNERLREMELLVQSKDKEFQEEGLKRKEVEERLKKAENSAEEMRENAKREAKEHASEIWKHKTAFIELVSSQRQIEAKMGRALRQVEATKQEVELVLEQKEDSELKVQKLSVEIVKMQEDMEQKDDILSAMLRKSKLDTAEKQMLLKEIKLSKSKRKQAELETERLRSVSESKHGGHSRSMLANQVNLKLEGIYGSRKQNSGATGSSFIGKARLQANNLLEYENPDFSGEIEACSPEYDSYSQEQTEALAITADVKRLEHWVHLEAEKYATLAEERHHLELNAFVEQMRLKDEKLEAFRWRMLSLEIESKRLRSHVECLNRDISQLRNTNTKLEALLLAREDKLGAFKEQLASQSNHINFQRPLNDPSIHDPELVEGTIWSEVKIVKRRPGHKEKKANRLAVKASRDEDAEVIVETALVCQQPAEVTAAESPQEVSEEQKDSGDGVPKREESGTPTDLDSLQNLPSLSQISNKAKSSSWKMDLQALGVSYKIKRLKQQLLMLEKLIGKQESSENVPSKEDGPIGIKSFLSLVSLLTKQVGRYQSLQEKADDLCKRMHENSLDAIHVDSSATKSRERTKTLENFLEETFQLQRYMVATGQKLTEIKSKITVEFVGAAEELAKYATFDVKGFADGMRTLFQEVQRGLEVRIARVIGDLEGTLACDGITHLRR